MISETSALIRFVRCPRCMKILAESSDVLVYECGGCGTHLQAKVRKENAKIPISGGPEIDASEMDKLDHVSDERENSSLSHGTVLHSTGEGSLNQSNGRSQIESRNCHDDKLTDLHLPNEDGNNVSDQNGSGDFDIEQFEDEDLANADNKSASDKNDSGICENQHESMACNIEQHTVFNEDFSPNELSHLENGKLSQCPLSATNSEVDVSDGSLPLAAEQNVKSEADTNGESNSTLGRSSQGMPVDTKETTSIATAQQSARENISHDIVLSSPNEILDQPQESANHIFDYAMPADVFENTDCFDPSSELSGYLIDMSKSPTTRSSRAYYDGVSSYEGTDDQFPDRHKHSSKHAYRLAKYDASDARARRERFPINSNGEIQHHFRTPASILPERTRYAIKSNKLDRDELQEPTRYLHPCKNWRRLVKDEYLSQPHFHRRESLAGYESGSPSNHNEFYNNSSFPAQDKMKLLRMVCELQSQLDKATLNDKTVGVASKDDLIRTNHGHDVSRKGSFHNLIYPRISTRLGEECNWSQQKKYSRIPFSAEATTGRDQVDQSFCCCPQEWKFTEQFPRSDLCQNRVFCRVHSHLGLYNSYGSCPSSPQRRLDSEFPVYSRGKKSDDQRQRNHEFKRYLREKHHLAKQHLRPIAGGAPLITCSFCLKQLQLPADFLLFKRRCHQLKCGACSNVLKFSLQDRFHLIPYTPSAEAPPQSEVDDYSDPVHPANLTSESHVSGPYMDSVSCSDNFRLSSCKSFSIDRDIDNNEVQGNVSNEHNEERRKLALIEARNKGKNPVQTCESACSSSATSKLRKASSEIEELPAAGGRRGGSPLHRLMGYFSASEIIYS